MNNNIIIYLGPSLSHEEARVILDADYRPPASHGDVISAVYNDVPSVIAIIDVHQEESLSVWHKEILDALNHGITVYGAGGIGALRAVELGDFGMKGVGWVYENFKSGRLDRDDEVLATFTNNSGTYNRLSESLVNMRATLQKAVQDGVIDNGEAVECIEAAKSIYYPDRNWISVLDKAAKRKLEKVSIENLKAHLKINTADIQRKDAILLIETIRDEYASVSKQYKKKTISEGKLFSVLYNRHRKVTGNGTQIPLYAICNHFGIRGRHSRELSESAFNKQLVLLLADLLMINVSDQELDEEIARFKNKYDLVADGSYTQWLRENDLSENDFVRLMTDEARIRRLRRYLLTRYYIERNTKFVLDELRLRNQYKYWKERTADTESILEHRKSEIIEIVNNEDYQRLLEDFFAAEDLSESVDLPDIAQEMGFNQDEFLYELARAKVSRESVKSLVNELFFNQ